MKLILLAVVTGLALAAALLGIDPRSANTAGLSMKTATPSLSAARSGIIVDQVKPVGPASHEDGNRARTDYLNQNVIDGVTTTVCAADAAMHAALEPAINAWNAALSNIANGAVLTRHAPTPTTEQVTDPDTGLLVTRKVCRGMHVEVLWRTDRTQASYCGRTGWGAAACYAAKRVSGPPPRAYFESNDNDDPDTDVQNYAIIYYQADMIRQSTLIHELGHVVGLRDYVTCDNLRAGRDITSDLAQPNDVDPLDDHYSVMAYPAACRYEGAITGRDLRDFYEAYRVGAITGIRLDGDATLSSSNALTAKFWWGQSGIAEANHNASHVAVLRQVAGSSSWTQVGTAMLVRNSSGVPLDNFTVTDRSGAAATYKIVGLTRGDIRRQGAFDVSRSFRVEDATSGSTTTAATLTEGDPTFVVGVAAYTEAGDNQIEVNGPNVLSASVSPRYCYQNNTLAVSISASGGSSTATTSAQDTTGASVTDSASVPCGSATGERSFTAKAVWGSGASKVTRTVSLPVMVHPAPVRITGISASIVPDPNTPAGRIRRNVEACARGERVTLATSPAAISPSPTYWVGGEKQTGSTFVCPATGTSVDILALRSDGGGKEVAFKVVEPLSAAFSAGRTATPRPCTAGSDGNTNVFITGGVPSYTITLGGRMHEPSENVSPTERYEFHCPSSGTTLALNVKDGVRRSASATVRLEVSRASSSTVNAPIGLRFSGRTQSQIVLNWRTVASGATGSDDEGGEDAATTYEVKLDENGPVMSASGSSYTFTELEAGTTYTLYVRVKEGAQASSWSGITVGTLEPALSTPTGVTVSATTTGITLGWTAVTGATRYEVKRSGATSSTTTTKTSHTFSGLTADTSYTLTLRALGTGSDQSFWVRKTVRTPLPTPTGLSATATATGLTLTWSTVSGATSYEVKRGASGATTTVSSGTSHPFTGLTANTAYTLYVRAKSSGGASSWASLATRTTVAPPPQPAGLSVSPTHNSLTLSWGSANRAASYDVRLRHDGAVTSTTGTSHTFGGLTSNTSYTLFVRARNAGGVSLWNSYTGTTTPPQPTGLSYSATSTSITLSWTADILADRYGVKRGASGSESGTSQANYTFSGLTANTGYTLYVRAKTPAGSSPWASIAVRTAPASPSGLSAAATSSSLTLTWSAVSGATSYEVKRGSSGSVTRVTSRSRQFTGLSANTSYTLYVRARNSGGASGWTSITQRTSRASLTAPTGLSASSTTSSLTLTWSTVSGATSYQVKRGSSGTVRTVSSGRSYTFSGLTADTSHTLYVRARNSGGTSGWTSIAQRTSRASLAAPTGLSVSSTTSSLTLTWSAVSGATSYQVKRGSRGTVRTVSSGRSYTFSGLTADTSYTLYVRARKGSTAYGWSSKSGRTRAITFSGIIRARIRSTGRVEFCFQPTGSSCVLPSLRYVTPSSMVAGRWYHSSSVSATVAGARRTLGKISVTKPSGASYIDVCFTPSGGSRVCPSSNNFYWGTATVDSWRNTDSRTYTLSGGASGQAESPENAMNPPDAGESDTPGADGGLMGSDP